MRFKRPSNNNKGNLDNTFRDGLRDMHATPDPDLWNRVSGDLDADIKKRKYNHWYFAALLILLPLTLTNVFINYDLEEYYNDFAFSETVSDNPIAEASEATEIKELVSSSNPVWAISSSKSAPQVSSNIEKAEQGNSSTATNQNTTLRGQFSGAENSNRKKTSQKARAIPPADDLTDAVGQEPVFLASLSPSFIENSTAVLTNSQNIENNEADNILNDKEQFNALSKTQRKEELNDLMKGLYVGVSSGVQYNRLLRREGQFEPFLGDNVTLSSARAFTYGGKIGWNFTRFLAFETGIYRSDLDVNYLDNRYDKIFTEGNINARYIEIPFALKFRYAAFNGINKLPHGISLSTGITYAQLRSASMTMSDTEIENASQYFEPSQLALNIGLDYEWFVHKNISLSAAASAAVFSSKEDFPKFSVKNANSDLRLNYQFQAGINFVLPVSK
ncbi:MAG: hypothetical protein WD048_15450 [Chitinophagales bacterium]